MGAGPDADRARRGRETGSAGSMPARTTTWSSRSRSGSCSRACVHSCAGARPSDRPRSPSATWCSTRRRTPSSRDGAAIELSAREFSLLEFLMRHAGEVVSRARILEHVWDVNFDGFSNVVDVYVGYLRRKLGTPEDTSSERSAGSGTGSASREHADPRTAHVLAGHDARRLVGRAGWLPRASLARRVAGGSRREPVDARLADRARSAPRMRGRVPRREQRVAHRFAAGRVRRAAPRSNGRRASSPRGTPSPRVRCCRPGRSPPSAAGRPSAPPRRSAPTRSASGCSRSPCRRPRAPAWSSWRRPPTRSTDRRGSC